MPSTNAAGEAIHQHGQVDPFRREPDIGDVPTPDLIGLAGGELFEQIGIGSQPATRVGRAHIAFDLDLESFLPHDPLDAFMVDGDPASPPFFRHATVAILGEFQGDLLDQAAQRSVLASLRAKVIRADRTSQPATQ